MQQKSRTVLPGRPEGTPQAFCTGEWKRVRVIAYVSGTALIILEGDGTILQTLYHNERLASVTFSEVSGKVAIAGGNKVYIYETTGYKEGYLWWSLDSEFLIPKKDGDITALSWGTEGELLVGSNSLSLWTTGTTDQQNSYRRQKEKPKCVWERPVANKIKHAAFSHDGTLIASVGHYDRLVKIWRKVSFGYENVQMDFSYIPHPRAVTELHWRKPFHPDQSIENVLHTICADDVLRVWAPVFPHEMYLLQLWASIPLEKPFGRDPEHNSGISQWSVMIIDSGEFARAMVGAVETVGSDKGEEGALQRLIEVAGRDPDVCVVFDRKGRMTAWGLENIGCKAKKTTHDFQIATGDITGIPLPHPTEEVRYVAYNGPNNSGLRVLAHYSSGKIVQCGTRIHELLDPAARQRRLKINQVWTGLSTDVKNLARSPEGHAVLSSTYGNEHVVWHKPSSKIPVRLHRKSIIPATGLVRRSLLLDEGDYALLLYPTSLVLYDLSTEIATEIGRSDFVAEAKLICLLLLPEPEEDMQCYHVVAVTTAMRGLAWEIRTPGQIAKYGLKDTKLTDYVKLLSDFELGYAEDLLMLLPVDPMGWSVKITEFLDKFSRNVAVSVSKSGVVKSWAARIKKGEKDLQWLPTSSIETGINNAALVRASAKGVVSILNSDKTELSIWNSRTSKLEYKSQHKKEDAIKDFDWTSTPTNQSILAVGFPHTVLLLSQLRYDYFMEDGAAWIPFRQIDIRGITSHPIGDSVWLSSASLVVGTGNQLVIHSRKIEDSRQDPVLRALRIEGHSLKVDDVFGIVEYLNGHLPVYHPQFLQQCILLGKTKLVERILTRLYKELRDFHEDIPIDGFLEIPMEDFFTSNDEQITAHTSAQKKSFYDFMQDDDLNTFSSTLAGKLGDLLHTTAIPRLTGPEQRNLKAIVECVDEVNQQRRSMDENAARFVLFFKLYSIMSYANHTIKGLSWREFCWGFHSESQEILIAHVARTHNNRVLWKDAKASGMFMWLKDSEAVKKQMEIIARNHYTEDEPKNPINCALYYLALKKKVVLLGLWRVAGWHKEAAMTARLLSNDFTQPKWRTAAQKNAYALMGKHRFEYAAAFFLLGDKLKDAVMVILDSLNDLQLAIAVTRCYEGDNGPVLRWILEERAIPQAITEQNRWLATWAFWMLHRRDLAVRALVSPLETLSLNPDSPPSISFGALPRSSQSFLSDDPALIVLYRQIRDATTQALRGAEKIPPSLEFQFVLHTARINDRMGCDILGLDLVRNWEFLQREIIREELRGGASTPIVERKRSSFTSMGTRKPSFIRDDDSNGILGSFMGFGGGGGGGGDYLKSPQSTFASENPTPVGAQSIQSHKNLTKPPPSVFEEPDMSWAFG